MQENKCINCSERKRCKDNFTSWIFFTIGLIATISVRLVIVLMHLDPLYGKIAWYIGISGFFLFFAYKFRINQTRSKIIIQKKLVHKLAGQGQLNKEENELIAAILCSLISKKEMLNYFFIFALSALSLIVAIYFDFIK